MAGSRATECESATGEISSQIMMIIAYCMMVTYLMRSERWLYAERMYIFVSRQKGQFQVIGYNHYMSAKLKVICWSESNLHIYLFIMIIIKSRMLRDP
jgi:hypothetical protein